MKNAPKKEVCSQKPWVIVWSEYGHSRDRIPRSFARSEEGCSPFEQAIRHAERWAARARITPVVLRPQKPWWSQPVESLPQENLAEQPFDRGSAPGILLAILRIYRKDPAARVILLSANCDAVAVEGVEHALAVLGRRRDVVVLAPSETVAGQDGVGQGSLLASRRVDGTWRVALDPTDARGGGIIVASAQALLQLFVDTQPELTDQFLTTLTGPSLFDDVALDRLYPFLPELDFCQEVLARAPTENRRSMDFAPWRKLVTPTARPGDYAVSV